MLQFAALVHLHHDVGSADELAVPLRRLYTTRALLGQFDAPGSTPWDSLGEADVATEAHRALALRLAEESLVLVHNNGTLPLDAAKTVCVGVAGPRAQDEVALLGTTAATPTGLLRFSRA